MISISDELREAIDNDARTIRTLIYFDDRNEPLIDGIISVTLTEQGFAGSGLSLGEFNTNQLKVSMYIEEADDLVIDENTTVRVVQQLMVDEESGTYEDIPIGTFYIYSIERSDDTDKLEFTAYDVSYKLSTEIYAPGKDVDFPTDSDTVFKDIMSQYGIEYVESSYEGKKIPFENYYQATCMNYIQYIAQFQNSNVRINRDGKLEFYWWKDSGYTIGRSKQIMGAFKRTSDVDFVVKGVNGGTTTVTTYVPIEHEDDDEYEEEYEVVEEEEPLAIGSSTNCVSFNNPFMTMDLLQPIYDFLVDFTYTACTVGYRGNPALELGDIVHVEDSKGELHDVLLSMHTIVLTGMKGDISCTDNQGVAETMSQQTPTDAKISAVVESIQRAYIKQADIEKLYVQKGEIENLDAKYATISDLEATNARIDNLDVTKLEARVAEIEEAYISRAEVGDLLANYITADTVEANYIRVDLANFTTAMVGQLLADSGLITNMTIENGYVTGMLNSVTINADVITTGTLSVDRLLITGEDGIIYEINMESSGLSASELTDDVYKNYINGTVIVANSITASQIAAGTITATEIASNTITADKLTINELSAISGDLGSITAGSIDIGNGNFIVDSAGNLYAQNAIIYGSIYAGYGEIAGWTINESALYYSLYERAEHKYADDNAFYYDRYKAISLESNDFEMYFFENNAYSETEWEMLNPSLDFEIGGGIFVFSSNGANALDDEDKFTYNYFMEKVSTSITTEGLTQKNLTYTYDPKTEIENLSNPLKYIAEIKDGFVVLEEENSEYSKSVVVGGDGLQFYYDGSRFDGSTGANLEFINNDTFRIYNEKGSLRLQSRSYVEFYSSPNIVSYMPTLYFTNSYDGICYIQETPYSFEIYGFDTSLSLYGNYITTNGDIFIGNKADTAANFGDTGVSIRTDGYICMTRSGNAGIYMEYGSGGSSYNGRCITGSSYLELSYGSTKGTITNYIRLRASRTDIYTPAIVSTSKTSQYGYDGCYIGTNGRLSLTGSYSNSADPGITIEYGNTGAWSGNLLCYSSYMQVAYSSSGGSADNYIREYSDNTRIRRTCYIGNNRSANYTATGISLNVDGYIEITRSGNAAVYLSSSTGSNWESCIRMNTSNYLELSYCAETRGTISNYIRLYSNYIRIPQDVSIRGDANNYLVYLNSSGNAVLGSEYNTGDTVICTGSSGGNVRVRIYGNGQYMAVYPNTSLSTSNTGKIFVVSTTTSYSASTDTSTNIALAVGTNTTGPYIRSYACYNYTNSNSANMYITTAGTFTRSTASSARYKNHINYFTNEENASQDGLDKSDKSIAYDDFRNDMRSILNIPVVQFHYNNGYVNGEPDFNYSKYITGFIAEDVYKNCPEATEFNEDGTVEMWSEKQMIPRMVFVLQEHDNDIEMLKKKVSALECECDVLHCENDRLQAQIEELLDK